MAEHTPPLPYKPGKVHIKCRSCSSTYTIGVYNLNEARKARTGEGDVCKCSASVDEWGCCEITKWEQTT